MNDSDRKLLEKTNNHVLCQWWCQMNRYEWPGDFPRPEPAESTERRAVIMAWIEGRCGHKEVIREWRHQLRKKAHS